jgi:hypothetical protein
MVMDVNPLTGFQHSDGFLAEVNPLYLTDRDCVAAIGCFEEPRHFICPPAYRSFAGSASA